MILTMFLFSMRFASTFRLRWNYSVSAQKFYIFACWNGYCGHRVFCRHRIDAGVLRNQLFQTAQQASAAGQTIPLSAISAASSGESSNTP